MLKAFYSLSFESVHRASIGLRIVRALHGHRPIALPSQFASPRNMKPCSEMLLEVTVY